MYEVRDSILGDPVLGSLGVFDKKSDDDHQPQQTNGTLDLRPYTRLLPHMHENYEVYSYIEWSVIPKNFLGMTDHSM